MNLNQRGLDRVGCLLSDPQRYRVQVQQQGGGRVVDCGIDVLGGLAAGVVLAEACLAGLGSVHLGAADRALGGGPRIEVSTDFPVEACMASQYAGWQLVEGKFFAMGSGPMRAAYAGEEIFTQLGYRETATAVLGVLESRRLPPEEVIGRIATNCQVSPEAVTLLVAPTASLAGGVQIVARSVETALHKLHEAGFDLQLVRSGWGHAPLPPVAADDLAAIGRTNDAILYGGHVTLWVETEDAVIERYGPQIPSSSSPDHGRPFIEIFEQYGRDFYKIDPRLFSPAVIEFVNLRTGKSYRFGHRWPEVVRRSFGI